MSRSDRMIPRHKQRHIPGEETGEGKQAEIEPSAIRKMIEPLFHQEISQRGGTDKSQENKASKLTSQQHQQTPG